MPCSILLLTKVTRDVTNVQLNNEALTSGEVKDSDVNDEEAEQEEEKKEKTDSRALDSIESFFSAGNFNLRGSMEVVRHMNPDC